MTRRNLETMVWIGLAIAAIALVLPSAAQASTNVGPNPGFEPGGCGASTPAICGLVMPGEGSDSMYQAAGGEKTSHGLGRLQGNAALQQARRAGIDIGAIIEKVSHRFEQSQEGRRRVVSEDRLYRAELGRSGFALTLRRKLTARELAARRRASRVAHAQRTRRVVADGYPAQAIPFQRRPAFAIRTSGVSGDGTWSAVDHGRWRWSGNSAMRSIAPWLRERLTAREGNLEWNFLLAHAPASPGGLRIESRISFGGAATRVRGAQPAWRFAAGAGRSVRLGSFRVKDARGRQLYQALPALAANRLAITVPARVLRRAAYPLTVDPTVSAEYPSSDPVYGQASPGTSSLPALAFDGSNYLVVWHDSRSGGAFVWGTRVSQAGTVLDPGGIAISTAARLDGPIAVAFGGTNFLVAWQDFRSGVTDDIYGTQVSTAGVVLDPSGIAISTAANDQREPAIGFDGTNFLVTWDDSRAGLADIYAARVSTSGSVLDPAGLAISTAANEQLEPAVAFDGTNYLVAWGDARSGAYRVYAARVSPAGSVLDPNGIPISSAGGARPGLAFDGTNYLVAWQSSANDIYGARVSPAGSVLDPQGIAISTAPNYQLSPQVAFGGGVFLVTWTDYRAGGNDDDIYGARLDPAGTVLDPDGIGISIAPNEQWAPAVAFDGTNFLVAFSSQNQPNVSDYSVRAARVSPVGTVLDPDGLTIQLVANNQHSPALAFDGTNYFVVWRDERSGTAAIYGARVTQDGSLLDGTGIVISNGANDPSSPKVSFDGTDFLVVWGDASGVIKGTRVSPSGTVLGPGGIAISPASRYGFQPAISFDGTNYLVVWTDDYYDPVSEYDQDTVYGARVSPAGIVLDPSGIPLSSGNFEATEPAIAFDGTNYLVAWSDGGAIYGTRVTEEGTVLDSAIPIATASGTADSPALAFDGTNYLVVWEDFVGSPTGSDIYGARVNPDGTVLDPTGFAISSAANNQTSPTLAFDGTNYLVAWADSRMAANNHDIYGARVSPTGSVLDLAGFVISATGSDASNPATVAGAGRIAVAYERVAQEPPYGGASRVSLRYVDLGPSPPDTTITSGPSGTVNSTAATFTFTASEPSTFTCSLDGAAFTGCSSPATDSGLADGSHTFQVRATDGAGNTDPTPAEQTWTIDTTPPDTTITSGPSGTVNSTSATLTFTAEPATFACSLDGAAFAACSSPKSYAGLGFGSHTFQVRATDAAGNTDPTPAQRTWTVNAPPTARFTFTCATLTCSFDGSSSSDSDGSIQSYSWSFGDGTNASGSNPPPHTYAQAASFTVKLTVTDDDGATGTVSHTVTLINLTAKGSRRGGSEQVTLSWTGPGATNFDLYRNGAKIATVTVTNYTDTLHAKGTYTYKACATTVSICSNTASVTF
jgi:hypothetical protein